MAKLKHQKRNRPRPLPARRHKLGLRLAAERRTQRQLDEWRRAPPNSAA